MKRGYIGQRSRKKRRNRFLLLLLILIIGLSIFFVYRSEDIDEEISIIEKTDIEKENIVSINKLENKLFETEQRLALREDLLNSLKKKIEVLENSNKEFINNIQLLNLEKGKNNQENIESQKKYSLEIQQSQKTIDQLNQELRLINDNYLSIQKKNVSIKKEIDILKNNNSTLELQKNIAFKKIDELNKIIDEQNKKNDELNKIIIEKVNLIQEIKNKFHD